MVHLVEICRRDHYVVGYNEYKRRTTTVTFLPMLLPLSLEFILLRDAVRW